MVFPNYISLPKDIEFFIPVLRSLSDGNEKTVADIYQDVIKDMNLSQDVLSIESNQKGKSIVRYKMEWALTHLKNKKLIQIPERSMRKITDYGLEILNSGISPQEISGLEEDEHVVDTTPALERTFFEYLEMLGLDFSTETVEDFLLSLKAKQFLILSGGTGTGKTRLAKAYGEYISHTEAKKIDFEVTIGKGGDNNGFTLSREVFFNNLPPSANRYSGSYRFAIGDIEGKSKIELAPRFWFDKSDPNVELAKKELDELSKTQKKAKLSIEMPTDAGSNYLVVPVGSDWTDNRHVLGYRNAITGTYAHTPSLDFIVRSNAHGAYPYLLILDEMNLSHVERYFSDIISSMESKEPVLLDSAGDDSLPGSISLDENLFIAGTVNMDETTNMFSPKVLDRANVLEFDPISISDYVSSGGADAGPQGDVEFLQDCMKGLECRTMNGKDIIEAMLADGGNREAVESMVKDLDSIQAIMSVMKLPFGFRTFDEVMRFMHAAWTYEGRGTFTNWKRYFDAQVKQKVLPKIHGNSSITVPLKELRSFCDKNGYPRSASKLEKMESVLGSQRYVSFNC